MIPLRQSVGGLGNILFKEAYIRAQHVKGLIPDVYVQDEKYFEDIKDELKAFFRLGSKPNDYVVIHVRRGDYVDNPFYVDLMKTDYYQKAMAMFPGGKFIVISDDLEWCTQQDIFERCEFIFGKSELDDLNLMIGAKAVIMANSSFSWWGGYLSNGVVVAPKAWHPDGIIRTVIPERFIKI